MDDATDPLTGQHLGRVIADTGQGPAVAALHEHGPVGVSDRWQKTRWPHYRQRLTQDQPCIRAEAAVCLTAGANDLGVLVLYSATPGFVMTDSIGPATMIAATAVKAADASDTAAHLRRALSSKPADGMTVGVLDLREVNEDAAFDLLRAASQHLHSNLRHAAVLDVPGSRDPSQQAAHDRSIAPPALTPRRRSRIPLRRRGDGVSRAHAGGQPGGEFDERTRSPMRVLT